METKKIFESFDDMTFFMNHVKIFQCLLEV